MRAGAPPTRDGATWQIDTLAGRESQRPARTQAATCFDPFRVGSIAVVPESVGGAQGYFGSALQAGDYYTSGLVTQLRHIHARRTRLGRGGILVPAKLTGKTDDAPPTATPLFRRTAGRRHVSGAGEPRLSSSSRGDRRRGCVPQVAAT